MTNKIYVTWNDIDTWCKSQLPYLKSQNFTGVYGVPRGGLVIATILSYLLDIPLLTAPYNNCLIVDDIADSGRTLMHYTENDTQFNKYTIMTYFLHPRSTVKPDIYCKEKEDNSWIVFPWEE